MAIVALEQNEFPNEKIEASTQSVTRKFWLKDASIAARLEFEQEVLGYSIRVGTTLSRKYPLRHPERPWLRAKSVTYSILDGDTRLDIPTGQSLAYDLTHVRPFRQGLMATVEYALPEWGSQDDNDKDPQENELWAVSIDG